MNLDKELASSCRCKILRVLSRTGSTNIMDLVRRVNSTYSQVNKNLQILEKEGIIVNRYFERVRIIKLNKESQKTQILILTLKILDDAILNEQDSSHLKLKRKQVTKNINGKNHY